MSIAPSATAPKAPVIEPKTLAELLALSPEQIPAVDIARANLLCADGLPGAEDLDVNRYLSILWSWTKHIRTLTNKYFLRAFHPNRAKFKNSEPYFRMIVLTSTLSKEYNVRYNTERIDKEDWSDSRDSLIHGLLGDKGTGTCASMPILVVAIGRRLGYPLHLVHTIGHTFVRWESADKTERLNFEFSGVGLSSYPDQFYKEWPAKWTPEIAALEEKRGTNRAFLRNLTPSEEFSSVLSVRAACLESAGRYEEALKTYDTAIYFTPHIHACPVHRKELVSKMRAADDLLNQVVAKTPNFNPELPADIAVKTIPIPGGFQIALDYKQLPNPIPPFDPTFKPPPGISPALLCMRNIVNHFHAQHHPHANFKPTNLPNPPETFD